MPASIERISALRLLFAICKTKQLSAAASRIGLSASGASHMLTDLKDQFQDPLFNRTGVGLTPTPKMEQLLPRITAILDAVNKLDDFGYFNPAEVTDTFRICTYDNAFMAFLLSVIPDIKKEAPKLNLEFGFVPETQQLIEYLRSGNADLAIHPQSLKRNDIMAQDLPALSYVLLVRHGHPLVSVMKKRPLTAGDLLPYTQLAPGNRPYATEPRPWEYLKRQGMSTIVQPYFNASPFLVLKTNYIEWIPRATAMQWLSLGNFVVIEPPEQLKIAIAPRLFWSRRANSNPLNQWIRSRIIAMAQEHVTLHGAMTKTAPKTEA